MCTCTHSKFKPHEDVQIGSMILEQINNVCPSRKVLTNTDAFTNSSILRGYETICLWANYFNRTVSPNRRHSTSITDFTTYRTSHRQLTLQMTCQSIVLTKCVYLLTTRHVQKCLPAAVAHSLGFLVALKTSSSQ